MTAIHVSGPFFLSTYCIPLFNKSDNPSVCMISSMAAEPLFRNKYVCSWYPD
jgi:NAD(P)-dependent dehydrogenase (short-subunit alcohol dehydrogenase family)